MIYTMQVAVEDSHVDCFGRLKPSAILYFAQEAAGRHCLLLGADYETLAAKRLFWAVTRNAVEIHRLPVRGEKVTVRTWPMPTTRVAYPRAMEICDNKGEVLVRGISLWVLMDMDKRTMVLPGKSGVGVEGHLTGTELESPRSLLPHPYPNGQTRQVTFSLLDRNGHMNNTCYLDWASDLLPAEFHQAHPVRRFAVCYLNEARENQQIRLHWELTQANLLSVDASRENSDGSQERVFAVQMEF